jgi:hypothetical protein
MLSLTLVPLFEHVKATKTFYIAGGDPEANRHITGIDLEVYQLEALGRMACSEQLKEALQDVSLLVSYSTRVYTQGLLEKTFPDIFLKRPVLDVISMYKLASMDMATKPTSMSTLNELIYWTEIEAMSVSGSYSLSACLQNCGMTVDENLPQYLRRGLEVRSLFNHLLT